MAQRRGGGVVFMSGVRAHRRSCACDSQGLSRVLKGKSMHVSMGLLLHLHASYSCSQIYGEPVKGEAAYSRSEELGLPVCGVVAGAMAPPSYQLHCLPYLGGLTRPP